MRTIIVLILTLAMVGSGQIAAQEQDKQPAPASAPATSEEISAMRAEMAELRAALASLQTAAPKKEFSIGVMPIEGAGRIPQVGDFFREVLVSALNEAGIQAAESLDRELVAWVLEQDRLVRERVVSPVTAPKRGELHGVTHFLLGTVTSYQEEENTRENASFLGWKVYVGQGVRVRTGRLVTDFRLVDAETGIIVDAFKTEMPVQKKTSVGGVFVSVAGGVWYKSKEPVPEIAARWCAVQAAQQLVMTAERRLGITRQLPPRLIEEPPADAVPEAKSKPEPTQSASAKSGPFPWDR